MSEKIALVDMDGTIADFDKAMDEKLQEMASPLEVGFDKMAGELSTSEIKLLSNKPYMVARRNLIKQSPGFWENLECIDDGFHVVKMIRALGFSINILTKGPYKSINAWTEKVKWCRKHIPYAAITITENKGIIYGKILFDDWPPYIIQWLKWRPNGRVLMLDQRWNQEFSHPSVFRVRRHPGLSFKEYKGQQESLHKLLTNV